MAVTSIHAPEIDESKYSLPIENGGTSARSPEQAAENIGLVSTDQVDQRDGIALLSSTNNVQRKNYPLSLSDTSLPVFFGDHAFYLDEEMTIQITNYDGLNTYTIDASRMQNTTCVMDGDQITLYSSNDIAGMQVLVINGREYTFEIKPRRPEQPFLVDLSGNLTANGIEITNPIPFEGQAFTSSNFLDTSGMLSHASTVWEISTNNTFNTLAFSSNSSANLTSWNVFNFTPGTSYFLRFAHVGNNGVPSLYSPTYEFITAEYLAVFKPSILSPIASAINVSPLPVISSSAFNFIGTGTFVSSTYYAHDTGYIDTAPSVQYFKVKKDATGLHYALSSSMEYVLWNGTTSAWSTMTYGQMWRSEGEAIRISGMTDLGSSIRVTVQFFDAHVGVRWQSTIDIPTPTITPIHLSSDWQLATDSDFTNIIRTSMNDGVNLTTWSPSQLPYLSIFYVKVRYRSDTVGSDGSPYSSWSNAVMFTTMADNRSIQKPVALMLNDDYTDISKTNPQFLGSAFTPVNYTDSHVKSQWQISTNSTFTNVVNDSGWSNDLTSYNPTVSLNEGTSYFARVRYQGNVKTSDWSDAVMFTTSVYLQISAVGAGGGGGGSSTNPGWVNSTGAAGGAGGGGGISIAQRPILPGVTYSLTVGSGGAGGGSAGVAGSAGGNTTVTVPSTALIQANGGAAGPGGSQNSSATIGGAGGWGASYTGGQGGQGGSMHADTGGGSYYAAGTAGQGINGGPGGLSDLAYGYGPYGGGGGGAPTFQVSGLAYQGGQGRNPNAYSVNGSTGSGGGGAAYNAGAGGAGGSGAVVVEYANTGPLLNTLNAIYENVGGKHRYIWKNPGTFTFTIAENVTSETETVTPPTVTMTGVPSVTPIANGSAFITDYVDGLHVATDWQLSTNATFTNIIASLTNDTTNKLAWQLTGLAYSTTYYVRCRYRSRFDVSEWSAAASFTTMADNRYIQAPSVAENTSSGSNRIDAVFISSAFTPVNFTGAHESSDWQYSYEPNFTTPGESLNNTVNLTNISFGIFPYSTYVYVRVRYRSQGIVSGWSPTLEFRTMDNPFGGGG